jgi:hypothetical protein
VELPCGMRRLRRGRHRHECGQEISSCIPKRTQVTCDAILKQCICAERVRETDRRHNIICPRESRSHRQLLLEIAQELVFVPLFGRNLAMSGWRKSRNVPIMGTAATTTRTSIASCSQALRVRGGSDGC